MATPRTTTTLTGDVHFLLYGPALTELLRGPSGPVVRELVVLGEKVKQEAIRIAPRRTGNLAHHIVKRLTAKGAEPQMLVGVENVKYAVWVHEGAQPHEIRPVNAPALVFFWEKVGGIVAFPPFGGGVVHHPGNKPNRFLIRALTNVRNGGI